MALTGQERLYISSGGTGQTAMSLDEIVNYSVSKSPQATTTVRGVVLRAASVPNLTDNSGGASGGNTIAAVTDNTTAANAIATLAAKVNGLQTALRNAGVLT
jgi:hypothetical protein